MVSMVLSLTYSISSSLALFLNAFLTALETFLLVIKKGLILNCASLQGAEKESSTWLVPFLIVFLRKVGRIMVSIGVAVMFPSLTSILALE